MRAGWFIFAVFFMLAGAGCSSTADRTRTGDMGNGRLAAEVTGAENFPGQNAQKVKPETTDSTGRAAITAKSAGMSGNTGYTAGTGNNDGLVLLEIKTPVVLGGQGSLTIQGQPRIRYTASAEYTKSGKSVTATAVKTSGADGTANWTWNISKDTLPGTYAVTVTGGGKQLLTTYTVTR